MLMAEAAPAAPFTVFAGCGSEPFTTSLRVCSCRTQWATAIVALSLIAAESGWSRYRPFHFLLAVSGEPELLTQIILCLLHWHGLARPHG